SAWFRPESAVDSSDRHPFFARRQETVVVNLGDLGQPCKAKRLGDQLDVLCQAVGILGTKAVFAGLRRDDLMIGKPSQSFRLDIEPGKVVVLAKRLGGSLRIGERRAPPPRGRTAKSFDRVP